MKRLVAFTLVFSLMGSLAQSQSAQNMFEDPPIIGAIENLTEAINHIDATFHDFQNEYGLVKVYGGLFGVMVTSALIGAITTAVIITCYLRQMMKAGALQYVSLRTS